MFNGLVKGKNYGKPSIFPLNMGLSRKFSLKPIRWHVYIYIYINMRGYKATNFLAHLNILNLQVKSYPGPHSMDFTFAVDFAMARIDQLTYQTKIDLQCGVPKRGPQTIDKLVGITWRIVWFMTNISDISYLSYLLCGWNKTIASGVFLSHNSFQDGRITMWKPC